MELFDTRFFEMLFLICFGISWPMNIVKAVRGKTSKGVSLWFLLKWRTSSQELFTSMGNEKSHLRATRSTPREPAARITRNGSCSMVP